MLATEIELFSDTSTPLGVALVVIFLLSPFTATLSPSFLTPVVPLSAVKVIPLLSTIFFAATPSAISALACCDKSTA